MGLCYKNIEEKTDMMHDWDYKFPVQSYIEEKYIRIEVIIKGKKRY